MGIEEKEVSKLRELLKQYKEENGTIIVEAPDSTNCYGCDGGCNNFCTNRCYNYCDGNSGSCWSHRWG